MWQTTYDSIEISIRQCQIIGLVTFKFAKTGYKSKILTNILINIAFQVVCNVAFFLLIFMLPKMHNYGILNKTLAVLSAQALVHFSSVMTSGIRNDERHLKLLRKMSEYDLKMYQYGFRINNKIIRKQMKWICMYKVPLFIFCLCIRLLFMHLSENAKIFVYFTYSLPIIVNYFITILLINYVLFIRMRFQLLNIELNNLIRHNIGTIENNKNKKLSEICMLYHELWKIVKHFNKTFGYTIFSMSWYCLCSITCGVYLIITGIKSDCSHYIGAGAVFSLLFTECAFSLSHFCNSVENEFSNGCKYIHNIVENSYDEQCRDIVQMFSLQLINNKVQFSAGGFFPVNYSLVFSV